MQSPMSNLARLVTAEELEHYPDDDYRYELVAGRVIRMSPVAFRQSGDDDLDLSDGVEGFHSPVQTLFA
jgi:hypothetical protein